MFITLVSTVAFALVGSRVMRAASPRAVADAA